MGKTILEMIDIKKSFSGIYALSGINFSLEMGYNCIYRRFLSFYAILHKKSDYQSNRFLIILVVN